jgi:hypothetical protein
MTIFNKSIDWGRVCDRCSDGPGCFRGIGPLVCPVDGSLLLYSESVEMRLND